MPRAEGGGGAIASSDGYQFNMSMTLEIEAPTLYTVQASYLFIYTMFTSLTRNAVIVGLSGGRGLRPGWL